MPLPITYVYFSILCLFFTTADCKIITKYTFIFREFSIGAVKTESKQFQYGYPKPEKDGPPPNHLPPPGYAGGTL